jgi:hypothetical protein
MLESLQILVANAAALIQEDPQPSASSLSTILEPLQSPLSPDTTPRCLFGVGAPGPSKAAKRPSGCGGESSL